MRESFLLIFAGPAAPLLGGTQTHTMPHGRTNRPTTTHQMPKIQLKPWNASDARKKPKNYVIQKKEKVFLKKTFV